MASRHDPRNRRPVCNALLKWQLQQDQQRLREVQQRLMRMAAPSPASLGFESSVDRQPTARRPRLLHHDPEEDALMSLIMEREEREAAKSNQNEHPVSRLRYPSVLPPLRRPEDHKLRPLAPPNHPAKNVTLRPTGQTLNAAGDFYSPVRPRESALNSLTSEFRQNLAFSRIKAPTATRFVATAAPSPRNPMRYDQMKTPDRWRTTAMNSNQDDLNESMVRRWEEEDAAQADRLLEKAAREEDNEALWDDLFYGTKAARAKTNQQNHPEQPEVYSTSSFPEVFSRSRSNSQGSSCYEDRNERFRSPRKTGAGNEGMLTSELSTAQDSNIGSRATGATAPTSTQTIAEMLASMEKSSELDLVDGDLVAGDDKNYNGSSGGGDRKQFSNTEATVGNTKAGKAVVSYTAEVPLWSMIVVASCLMIGIGGFFIEELMSLMGLFSKNTTFTLSKAEQKRMHDRVSELQQVLEGFQHSTAEMEVKSQTVLSELQHHMNRMRIDRQDMLTTEMQELRRHVLHVTHELVEKERESMQSLLKEVVRVQIFNEDDKRAISDMENEQEATIVQESEGTTKESSQSHMNERGHESSTTSSFDTQAPQDNHVHIPVGIPPLDNERMQDQGIVLAPVVVEEVATSVPTSVQLKDVPVKSKQTVSDVDQETVASPQPIVEVIVEPQEIDIAGPIEPAPQTYIEQVNVEPVQDVGVVPLREVENKGSISVEPVPNIDVIVKPPRSRSGMSLDGILLLVGIMFLVASVVLRVYNINRRKRWFENRRKRRSQRALLLAQQRARAMADSQDDSDEWDGNETDGGVEEVALMTPIQDSEDDEATSELQRQSPEIDTDFDDQNDDEEPSNSPAEAFRVSSTKQRISSSSRTNSKTNSSLRSPLKQLDQLRHRRRQSEF